MTSLRLLECVFHLVLEDPPEQLGHLRQLVGHHRADSDARPELYQSTQGVHIAIEPAPPFLVTVEDHRLPKAQGHRSFGILAVAFAVASAVDESLSALDHETLDQTLVFMTRGRAQRRIE